MKYEILRITKREGQFEIVCNIYDELTLVCGNYIHALGAEMMDSAAMDALFSEKIFPLFAKHDEILEKIYLGSEVTRILRDKKYIGQAVEFSEDMPVAKVTQIEDAYI